MPRAAAGFVVPFCGHSRSLLNQFVARTAQCPLPPSGTIPLCTHAQTQNGAVQEFKEGLEKRATRLARRLDEEQASHDREREAHASELLAVKAQVGDAHVGVAMSEILSMG